MALSITYFDTTEDGHSRYLLKDPDARAVPARFTERLKKSASKLLGTDFVRVEDYTQHLYLVVQRGTGKRHKVAWRDLCGWVRVEGNQ